VGDNICVSEEQFFTLLITLQALVLFSHQYLYFLSYYNK
jgi:hypothetical protein